MAGKPGKKKFLSKLQVTLNSDSSLGRNNEVTRSFKIQLNTACCNLKKAKHCSTWKGKSDYDFDFVQQGSAGKGMKLGNRRHWQNLPGLLFACWETSGKSFTFSSSGFFKKMMLMQPYSLCLTIWEFPWPISNTFDRE